MYIELASTLTREDENRLAPAVLKAISGMLDMLPIAYAIRIETTDQSIQQLSGGYSGDRHSGNEGLGLVSDGPIAAVES